MALMILGLALWYATHLEKIYLRGPRAQLVARIGTGPFKGLVAVLTVGAVALMVIGYQQAPYIEVWPYVPALVHLNNLLMVLAVALLVAGGIPGHLRHWVRHPQLTAVKTWAVAHLLVNGDLASVVLFAGLLAWAVIALIGINKRDGKGAKPGPGTLTGNLIHLGVTAVVFGALAWAHNYFGVWPYPA